MSNRAQEFADEFVALLKKYNATLEVVDRNISLDGCDPQLELDFAWQEGEGGYWDTIRLPKYLDGSSIIVAEKYFKKS